MILIIIIYDLIHSLFSFTANQLAMDRFRKASTAELKEQIGLRKKSETRAIFSEEEVGLLAHQSSREAWNKMTLIADLLSKSTGIEKS